MITRFHKCGALLCASAVTLLLLSGCREKDAAPQTFELEGKIEKIAILADGTGEITIAYFSEKHDKDVRGVGLVTPKTNILINDQPGKLADLKEGDRVRGQVRIEKDAGKKRMIAVRIMIDRAIPNSP